MARRRRRNNRPPTGLPIDPRAVVPDPGFKPVSVQDAKMGWRAWVVDRELPRYGLPPKLRSVSFGYDWRPRQKAEAECPTCSAPDAPLGYRGVPGESCSCGFYSAKSLKHLMRMGYHLYDDVDEHKYFKVVGQVACWGKVVEGTQGWRVQYAYPYMLFVPFEAGVEFGQRLREGYGCKVRLLNFLKQPGEITDEFLADLMAGRAPTAVAAARTPRQTGRRVTHRALRFTGHTVSEPYKLDGVKVVEVAWDVTPDRKVKTAVADLEFAPLH
jgi:hypothetical protein